MLLPRNTTRFAHWFWKYCWMTENPAVIAHMAFETETLYADPTNTQERYFVDYAIETGDGLVFVHKENQIQQ